MRTCSTLELISSSSPAVTKLTRVKLSSSASTSTCSSAATADTTARLSGATHAAASPLQTRRLYLG